MKKNFFKKLSFVLALAMIISVIAPAAGAFAAESLALNKDKVYLHLSGQPGSNDYNFNINGTKKSGWKYQWTSSNEAVATVATNGLTTAKSIGTAKITVTISDSKGAEVDKLTADVSVKDNIETVKISNPLAADKTLKVNEVYDFNRSFTTLSGSTTKTTSVTRWVVDKADKATIDASGKFKATEAGQYKVTALAFQSTAKYDEYVSTKNASLVLDTDETTVTVVAGIVETKQLNTTKFKVVFDSDMSKTDVKSASVVYQIINGKQVSTGTEKIKSVSLDTATGKIATVEMYTALNPKTDYNFVFGTLVGKFTAASTDVADVAGIVFDDFDVNITSNVDMLTKVNAVNKDGVVILPGSALSSYLTFSYGGDLSQGYAGGNTAYIYKEGYSAVVTATYSNYVYNATTKTYDNVKFTDSAVAKGVKTDTSLNSASVQYAVVSSNTTPASNNAAWGAAITVPAGDGGYYIHTRYKKNNDDANAPYTDRETLGSMLFTYESSNTDKLLISGNSIYPIAQGVVTVIVKNAADGKVVGTFDVAIQASRAFAVASIDKNSVQVGNNSTLGEVATATVTVKDTMGASFTPALSTPNYSIVNRPSSTAVDPGVTVTTGTGDNVGKVYIAVDGKNATVGAYNIKVTLSGYNSSKDVYVTAIVVDGTTNNTVANWAVELGSSSVNLKENTDTDISIKVYGYNSNGVRVAELTPSQYTVTVKKGDTTVSTNNTTIPVVSGDSPAALSFYEVNTYVVTAYVDINSPATTSPTGRVDGAYIGAATFTVTDTTTKTFAIDTTVVPASSATVLGAVKAALTFKLNGADITEANITRVTYSTGAAALTETDGSAAVAAGNSIYVSAIKYTVHNTNGTDTVYTFNVGVTIKVQ